MALEANERPNKPIAKFESMLKTDDVYFFDAEDLRISYTITSTMEK